MINCICINDLGRPKEISPERWVKFGERYRISHIYYHPEQGVQGCSIYEKPLDESCKPYETFILQRFAVRYEDIPSLNELAFNCTQLNGIDLSSLINIENERIESTVEENQAA